MQKFVKLFFHAILVSVAVQIYYSSNTEPTLVSSQIFCEETKNVDNITINYNCDKGKLVAKKNTKENKTILIRNGLYSLLQKEIITQAKQEISIPIHPFLNVSIQAEQDNP
jgi:membrane-bound inhibitor of C-type lysozyme